MFFWNLFGYDWELTKSPAGAHQWIPKGMAQAPIQYQMPTTPSKGHAPLHADHGPRPAVTIRSTRRFQGASTRILMSSKTPLPRRGSS